MRCTFRLLWRVRLQSFFLWIVFPARLIQLVFVPAIFLLPRYGSCTNSFNSINARFGCCGMRGRSAPAKFGQAEEKMANKNRGKRNQPPTGRGKKQSPYSGSARKLSKRSEVLQAQRNHPEENVGTAADETNLSLSAPLEKNNPLRKKAGR
jgi:hypothetical protein